MTKTKEEYNAYMAKYMVERYHRRRSEWIKKLGDCCIDCKSQENLEFDHDDPETKSFDVAKALSGWSNVRLESEMKKCVLRCKSCHANKTYMIDNAVNHGEGLTGKRNCRCDLCRPLKNAYVRDFKKRKANK